MPLKKIIETEDGIRLDAFLNPDNKVFMSIEETQNSYNSGYITLTKHEVADLIMLLIDAQAQ